MANADARPAVAMATPAIAGPRKRETLKTMDCAATAGASNSSGTRLGISDIRTGWKALLTMPRHMVMANSR